MTNKKLKLLFDLAEELYIEEQKKRGLLTQMPYVYAENKRGAFLAISIFGVPSARMKKKLRELRFDV